MTRAHVKVFTHHSHDTRRYTKSMNGLRVTRKPTRNSKLTGDSDNFFATYRAVGFTCPNTCALLNKGCYAQHGNTAIHQRDSYSENDGAVFRQAVLNKDWIVPGSKVRLHVSGDIMKNGTKDGATEIDWDYLNAMIETAIARPDVHFYGYTHAWKMFERCPDFPENFVLNASCDTAEDVELARSLGWDTTTVVPATLEGKRYGDMVVCPNQTTGLTCDKCKLCFKANRKLTVAFKAHGSGKNKVSARVELPLSGM